VTPRSGRLVHLGGVGRAVYHIHWCQRNTCRPSVAERCKTVDTLPLVWGHEMDTLHAASSVEDSGWDVEARHTQIFTYLAKRYNNTLDRNAFKTLVQSKHTFMDYVEAWVFMDDEDPDRYLNPSSGDFQQPNTRGNHLQQHMTQFRSDVYYAHAKFKTFLANNDASRTVSLKVSLPAQPKSLERELSVRYAEMQGRARGREACMEAGAVVLRILCGA
jgi:hypothetical protein